MTNLNYNETYFGLCQQLIEKKLGWTTCSDWRNYEFVLLGEKILEATGVNLSVTTLKRIFGKVNYTSKPSSYTLNALAAYLGYTDWINFKSSNPIPGLIEKTGMNKRITPSFFRKFWVPGLILVILCITAGIIILQGTLSPGYAIPANVVFNSRVIAEGLPNSVVFNMDLKGIHSPNIKIQQFWDSTKTIRIQPGQTEATGIYYRPGYFHAKLMVDGRIIKEHDLFIKSEDWLATIDREPIPVYLKNNELLFNGTMSISGSAIKKIAAIPEPVFLTYHLVKPFGGLQSNDFIFETSIKNIYGEDMAVCKTSKIFILCKKGAFIVPFTIPGCASDINLMLNDYYLDGKTNDLSCFNSDFSGWQPIRIEAKNRKVKIFINNRLIREENYRIDAGEIVGVRLSFLGAGSVDYIRLKDSKGVVWYDKGF